MNLAKLCKLYVGIGMVYAGVLFVGARKIDKERYDQCSIESKVSVFAYVVLTWPKYVAQLVKAGANGAVDGYCQAQEEKESTNESES